MSLTLTAILGIGSLALKVAPMAVIGGALLTGNGEWLGGVGKDLLSGLGDIIVGIVGEDSELGKLIRKLQNKEIAEYNQTPEELAKNMGQSDEQLNDNKTVDRTTGEEGADAVAPLKEKVEDTPELKAAKNDSMDQSLIKSLKYTDKYYIPPDTTKLHDNMKKDGWTAGSGDLESRIDSLYSQAYLDCQRSGKTMFPSQDAVNARFKEFVLNDPDLVYNPEKTQLLDAFDHTEPINSEKNKAALMAEMQDHYYTIDADGNVVSAQSRIETAIEDTANDPQIIDFEGGAEDKAALTQQVFQENLDKQGVQYTPGSVADGTFANTTPDTLTAAETARHAVYDVGDNRGIAIGPGPEAEYMVNNGWFMNNGGSEEEAKALIDKYYREALHETGDGTNTAKIYEKFKKKLEECPALSYDPSMNRQNQLIGSITKQTVAANDEKLNSAENLKMFKTIGGEAGIHLSDEEWQQVLDDADRESQKYGFWGDVVKYKDDQEETERKTAAIIKGLHAKQQLGIGVAGQVSEAAFTASAGTYNGPADAGDGAQAPSSPDYEHGEER